MGKDVMEKSLNFVFTFITKYICTLLVLQEKQTLLRQVGTIEKLRQEAEKEADQAVAQLEEFVKDQEKVVSKVLHHNDYNAYCSKTSHVSGPLHFAGKVTSSSPEIGQIAIHPLILETWKRSCDGCVINNFTLTNNSSDYGCF